MRNCKPIIIGITTVGLVLLLILILLAVDLNTSDSSWSDQLVSYSVVENDDTSEVFEKLWSQPNLFAQATNCPCPPPMAAAMGKVFIVANFDRPTELAIVAFEATNGTLLWRNDDSDGQAGLYATSQALYAGSTGSGKITAYELDTGQVLWSRHMPGARYIRRFSVVGNLIYVLSSSGYHLVQTDTGEIVQTFTNPLTVELLQEAAGQLAITSTTPIKLEYFEGTAFTEDTIFFTQVGTGDLEAIDRQTGDRLWGVKGVIGNVVATEAAVYLLTKERKLLALKSRNGEIIDSLQFQSGSLDITTPSYGFATAFYVAFDTNERILYTFLGDGGELFAFRVKL